MPCLQLWGSVVREAAESLLKEEEEPKEEERTLEARDTSEVIKL